MSSRRQERDAPTNSRILSAFSKSLVGWEVVGDTLQVAASDDPIVSRPRRFIESSDSPYQELLAEQLREARGLTSASQTALSLAESIQVPLRPSYIKTLPNEIFFEIFDKMLPTSEEHVFRAANAMTVTFPFVCRRFREMILSFSKAWSYMNLDWLDLGDVERHLARSKNLPLHVQFDYINDMERILLRALEQKDRWVYLRCTFTDGDWRILGSCPSIAFPALRTLRIHVGHDTGGIICDELFSRWKFPKVEDLVVQDHIPVSGVFDHGSLITMKYITDHAAFCSDGTFLRSLIEFLVPLNTVRTLELDLSQLSRALLWQQQGSFQEVVLPSVTTFSATNTNFSFNDRYEDECYGNHSLLPAVEYAFILRTLHMPNAQKISLRMMVPPTSDLTMEQWFFTAFHHPGLNIVTEFELEVRFLHPPNTPWYVQLYDIFWVFRHLRDLSVDVEDCHYDFYDDWSVCLESLRSLRLRNFICTEHPFDAFCTLREDGANLEEIFLHSEVTIDGWESLSTVFPKAKIDVIEEGD